MKKKIESYQGAAGGWGAVKSVANAVRKQMDIRQDVIAMFDMNKPEGFDCPGCAWPDPKHSASFDICENGAKAIAWEVTDKQVNASFFAATGSYGYGCCRTSVGDQITVRIHADRKSVV